jgi:Tfp pilus assembly protein PilO
MTISAATNITKRTHRQLLISLVIVIAALITQILLAHFAWQNTSTTVADTQEQMNAHLSSDGVNAAQAFVTKNPEAAQILIDTFPNQSTFPNIIALLEGLVSIYDPRGQIAPANVPKKVQNELSLPLEISFTAGLLDLTDFLLQLEQLPHVIEITSLEIRSPQGQDESVNINIGTRVYVQDPFTKITPR